VENPWRAPPNMPLQHPKVVREAHLEVKALKAHHVWNNFGSVDVEKAHVVLVRSTFGSKNVKMTCVGALLEVENSKSVRHCGAKHI
jgi:hypothetical protein